jgi:hypothetical protein
LSKSRRVRGQDLNLRPSGYEPDELPGCSTPRRCGGVCGSGLAARRRPTLPQLGLQYHGRWGVSRPSSGWDRVLRPRDGHRATGPDPVLCGSGSDVSRVCGAAGLPARWWAAAAAAFGFRESGGGGRSVGARRLGQDVSGRSAFGRLGPLGCAHCCASTCGLSTCWSGTALGETWFGGGFPA